MTAAVLTTQPTLADTVTVDNSHSGVYPSIFTTSISSEDDVTNTFSPLKDTVDNKNTAPVTLTGVEPSNVKPVNRGTSGANVTGKTGVIINAIKKNQQKPHSLRTADHRSLTQGLKKPSSSKISYRNN
ncbi:MAG: TolC family protein, partial [Cyanobacteria bacterium P01_C01_bin.38]